MLKNTPNLLQNFENNVNNNNNANINCLSPRLMPKQNLEQIE